jgi:hypothetical protein
MTSYTLEIVGSAFVAALSVTVYIALTRVSQLEHENRSLRLSLSTSSSSSADDALAKENAELRRKGPRHSGSETVRLVITSIPSVGCMTERTLVTNRKCIAYGTRKLVVIHVSRLWCKRQDTVSGVLELLRKEHLVQV